MAKSKPVEKKPWSLTQADINSTTQLEFVWGTTRLLPPVEIIPKPFWDGNTYSRIADSMFVGAPPPAGEVIFNPGFSPQDAPAMMRCLMAHMKSFEPDHHHKIAGVAFMMAQIVHVTAILT